MRMKHTYYFIKPIIPRRTQLFLRRQLVNRQVDLYRDTWPIKKNSAVPPNNWHGWPRGKKFAFILTHDVELQFGHDKCYRLMMLEKELGFRSSFNFVPERYEVSPELRKLLTENGFEVGVHGLQHDGKLYLSKKEFLCRAKKINRYLREWNSCGFRSPSMHHNLEWINELNIEYDASTFDTDPFEPQSDGCGTIFPFIVEDKKNKKSYVELPYTLPQDFSLFVIMKEPNIDIWKKKIDWIAEKGGMALLNVHPDYINFNKRSNGPEEFSVKIYKDLLNYVKDKYEGEYYHALPKDLTKFFVEERKLADEEKRYDVPQTKSKEEKLIEKSMLLNEREEKVL